MGNLFGKSEEPPKPPPSTHSSTGYATRASPTRTTSDLTFDSLPEYRPVSTFNTAARSSTLSTASSTAPRSTAATGYAPPSRTTSDLAYNDLYGYRPATASTTAARSSVLSAASSTAPRSTAASTTPQRGYSQGYPQAVQHTSYGTTTYSASSQNTRATSANSRTSAPHNTQNGWPQNAPTNGSNNVQRGRGRGRGQGRGRGRGQGGRNRSNQKESYYHYTNRHGARAIEASGKILMARDHNHFGEGVYFTKWNVKDGRTKEEIAKNNFRAGGEVNLGRGRVDWVVEVKIPFNEIRKCNDRKRDIWRYPNRDLMLAEYDYEIYEVEEDVDDSATGYNVYDSYY